jgi:hypothetical protein
MLIALNISRLPIYETTENIDRFIKYSKKFWEELIAYSPWQDTDRIKTTRTTPFLLLRVY